MSDHARTSMIFRVISQGVLIVPVAVSPIGISQVEPAVVNIIGNGLCVQPDCTLCEPVAADGSRMSDDCIGMVRQIPQTPIVISPGDVRWFQLLQEVDACLQIRAYR